MHIVGLEHEMLDKLFWVENLGFGLETIDQVRPFQRSAKVSTPVLALNLPTALQLAVLGHETPNSRLLIVPRLGLGTRVHVFLLQRATKVKSPPVAEE